MINIYGCSEAIKNLKEIKHPAIGLNNFPKYFPLVDHWFFVDEHCLPHFLSYYQGQKVITTDAIYYKYLKDSNIKPHYIFEPNIDLYGKATVASFALDFALKQGYTHATLWGIFDVDYKISNGMAEYKHFYNDKIHEIPINQLLRMIKAVDKFKKKMTIKKGFYEYR